MPLLSTRGPCFGKCNICGESGRLTEDHTPPQACSKPTAVELEHVTARLATQKTGKVRILQSGVKYRSLCDRCNSGVLGARYDPALIKLSNDLANLLKSSPILPRVLNFSTEPDRIARSVFGHLKAQGIGRYEHGPKTDAWKDFFFDLTRPAPESVKIYYWLYPYRRRVLIRDAVIGDLRTGEPAVCWIMKFYPLAFAIWDSKSPYPSDRLRDLAPLCGQNGAAADVVFDLDFVPHELFMQAPQTTQAIMYGQEAVTATEYTPRRKR